MVDASVYLGADKKVAEEELKVLELIKDKWINQNN